MEATTCRQSREWIQQAAFEDLPVAQTEALEDHLRDCAECRQERRTLESALAELRSFPEAPVPRHFYVNPQPRRATPWSLFLQLTPVWRAAAACLLLAALVMGGAAASRLQVQSEDGVLRMAFGEIARTPKVDPDQLKLELVRQFEARLQESRLRWLEEVREEIERSAATLSDQQKEGMRLVASRLENRLEERQRETLLKADSNLQATALQLYRTLSGEQRRQLALVNDRIDLLTVNGQIQDSQTEALMATMLQIADLRGAN